MRISVTESGDRKIRLQLPTGLVLNSFTARIFSGSAKKHGVHITPKQAAALAKALNAYRRCHPDWVLVDVRSTDGSRVEITL